MQVHYNAIAGYTTFESFMWSVPYTPHGPVHQIMGGTFGCEVRLFPLPFLVFLGIRYTASLTRTYN